MPNLVTLRADIQPDDLSRMMNWMANEHVYRYLNEHQQINVQLKQVYDARLPVLTPLFNRNGRFLMICTGGGQAIGFLRMAHAANNSAEIVIAIGDESIWGKGYGRSSLSEALKIAFFDMRKERVIAHIYNENRRSQRLFENHGFAPQGAGEHMTKYELTLHDYLHPDDEKSKIA